MSPGGFEPLAYRLRGDRSNQTELWAHKKTLDYQKLSLDLKIFSCDRIRIN